MRQQDRNIVDAYNQVLLEQGLSSGLQEAFETNTSIKLASGVAQRITLGKTYRTPWAAIIALWALAASHLLRN